MGPQDSLIRGVNVLLILVAGGLALFHFSDSALQEFTFTSTSSDDITESDTLKFERRFDGFEVTDATGAYSLAGFVKAEYDKTCDVVGHSLSAYPNGDQVDRLNLLPDTCAAPTETDVFTCNRVPGCRHNDAGCVAQASCDALVGNTNLVCKLSSALERPASLPCQYIAGGNCADYADWTDSLQHMWPTTGGWDDNCEGKTDWRTALVVSFSIWLVCVVVSVGMALYMYKVTSQEAKFGDLANGTQVALASVALAGLLSHIAVAVCLGGLAHRQVVYDIEETFFWKFAALVGGAGGTVLTIEEDSADGAKILLTAFALVMISTGIVVSRLVAFGVRMSKGESEQPSQNLYAQMSLL